jgi:hypothetical protein
LTTVRRSRLDREYLARRVRSAGKPESGNPAGPSFGDISLDPLKARARELKEGDERGEGTCSLMVPQDPRDQSTGTRQRTDQAETSTLRRLLREPTLHFFVIAGAVLFGQRLLEGDPRTIEISAPLRADLLRRFQDQLNRPPTTAEGEAFIEGWKAEEALYREALREGIDRDDATVRKVLIDKMRERMMLQARIREPSEAELQRYLEQNRSQFEAPLIYEYESVEFPKQEPRAQQERAQYEPRLAAGATPASLGLRSVAANVNRDRIVQEFGAETAEKICRLPVGQWHELETNDRWLLVKLTRIQGGLPEPEVLRPQLVAGWKGAMIEKAVARATHGILERYRFEEQPR